VSYQYIGEGKNENAYVFGELYEKEILRIRENAIEPFKHELKDEILVDNPDTSNKNGIDYGYFVYDGKLDFYSEIPKLGEAYKCDYDVVKDADTEVKRAKEYSCLPMNNAEGYYYANTYNTYIHKQGNEYPTGGKVMYGSGNRWKVETARGYYFFNKSNLPAKTNKVDNSEENDPIYVREYIGSSEDGFRYSGKYLNSAVVVNKKQNAVLIEYEKLDNNNDENIAEDFKISDGLKYCTVKSDGTCSSDVKDVTLGVGGACYYNGKLYIVDSVNEGEDGTKQKTLCYSGSKILKYRLINGNLYQLDSLSIQRIVNSGVEYYMLNKNLEKFESNYPEVPDYVIICNEGSCTEKDENIILDQTVLINDAKKYLTDSWTMMKYYNEENGEKYMDMIDEPDKCYCLNDDKNVPKENVDKNNCEYIKGDCSGITINYASTGSNMILKFGVNVETDTSIKYNEELDVLEYNNEYNKDSGKRVFKFIGNNLYLLKRRRMVPEYNPGIYLMMEGKQFNSTEWTLLSGKTEVCYYESGSCNEDKIKMYRTYRYNINLAMPETAIVEYDNDNDKWRTVREDGLYFFFEDNYAINSEDRRITNKYEINNGRVELKANINEGYHIFNNLVVERNSANLEDGILILENVEETSNRKCKAIETSEVIENDEYCYNRNKGLCVVKTAINDSISSKTNCMFGENETYYYKVNDDLYRISSRSNEKINSKGNVGLYIIDEEDKGFNSKMEGKAKVYNCNGVVCSNINDLETQYYYNSANKEILYYK